MLTSQILVAVIGISISVWVAWYFWFSEKKAVRIKSQNGSIQEAVIKVKGGYNPDVLIFEAGKPIKLNFIREETASCSEEVIFPDLHKMAKLTPFKTVTVELKIDKPGEYGFQCGMGMLNGKLIIE